MLTPADINNQRFSTTRIREGYDQEEVDGFLDRVAEDYQTLVANARRLEAENATLRRLKPSEAPTVMQRSAIPLPPPPPSPPPVSAVAEKLLLAAEKAASEHEAEAKAKAEEIVREAGARGARIVEGASEAAERIKSEGLAEKFRRNEELDKKYAEQERRYTDLVAEGSQARRALTAAIAAYDKEESV